MSNRPSTRLTDKPHEGTPIWLTVFVLLTAFGLRVFRLDWQSLWYDEGYSVGLAGRSVVDLITATAADIHPPLYYVLLKAWIYLAGNSEFSLRYLSLMLGVLTVPATYILARRLLGRRVALVTAFLVAGSPFYVHYSQEVRMYTLLGLTTQLAVFFFIRGMYANRTTDWVGYVGFVVLGLYSHLYAALIFGFLNVAFLALVILDSVSNRRAPNGLCSYVLSQVLVVVLFLPWLQVAIEKLATYSSPAGGSPIDFIVSQTVIVFSLGHSVLGITTFPGMSGYRQDLQLGLVLATPFLLLGLLGVMATVKGWLTPCSDLLSTGNGQSRPVSGTFTLAYLVVPFCTIVLTSLGHRDFNARYLYGASTAYYLLIAIGIISIGKSWHRQAMMGVAVLVLAGVWGFVLHNYYFVEKYSRDDHRSAVAYLRDHMVPGDLVVLNSPFDPVYTYYAGDMLDWVRLPKSVPPDDQHTLSILAEIVPQYPRVWLIMWGDYFIDPDRIVQTWLDEHGFRFDGIAVHGPIIVYRYLAKSPVLEDAPQPARPMAIDFGGELSILGYDLRPVSTSSSQRIHLTTYWQALSDMSVDYSLFVHLINSAGQMAGVGDSQPVNGRLPTTTWRPGETIRDELDVWIFPATPPGEYRLIAGVYDSSTMKKLRCRDGYFADLGTVSLVQRTTSVKGLDHQTTARVRFEDAIELVGYTIANPSPEVLHLTLFWRAMRDLDMRYAVFNHLVDPGGEIVAQHDGEPGGGHYPTSLWQGGEVIRDEHTIYLPEGIRGRFQVISGLYDPYTGERLEIPHQWFPWQRESTHYLGEIQF